METLIKAHKSEITPNKNEIKELLLIYEERYIELCQELEDELSKKFPLLRALFRKNKYKDNLTENDKELIKRTITKKIIILTNTKEKLDLLKPQLEEVHKNINQYFERIILKLEKQKELVEQEKIKEFLEEYSEEQRIEKEIEKEVSEMLKQKEAKQHTKKINLPKYHLRGIGAYRVVLIILELLTTDTEKSMKENYELSKKVEEIIIKQRTNQTKEERFLELFREINQAIEQEKIENANKNFNFEKQSEDVRKTKEKINMLKEAYKIDTEYFKKVNEKIDFLETKLNEL